MKGGRVVSGAACCSSRLEKVSAQCSIIRLMTPVFLRVSRRRQVVVGDISSSSTTASIPAIPPGSGRKREKRAVHIVVTGRCGQVFSAASASSSIASTAGSIACPLKQWSLNHGWIGRRRGMEGLMAYLGNCCQSAMVLASISTGILLLALTAQWRVKPVQEISPVSALVIR